MSNVLFLCTGNSARSVLAESYLNHLGRGFRAWSAGSRPVGAPNPLALKTLARAGIDPRDGDGAPPRSKSWDEFALSSAPRMDVVITVCDNAAGEVCPIWPTAPGAAPPKKLHWSFPDPAAATGSLEERLDVFEEVFKDIRARIDAFAVG
jgi:arsenate reductase